MKKILAFFVIATLCLTAFIGCGKKTEQPDNNQVETQKPQTTSQESDAKQQQSIPDTTPESGYDPAEDEDTGRFFGGSFSETLGSLTIKSEWIPFEVSQPREGKSDALIAVYGDAYFLLMESVLKQYKFDGTCLVFEKDIPLAEKGTYDILSQGDDGTIYLSGASADLVSYKDGELTVLAEGPRGPRRVFMHPSGEWGVNRSGKKVVRGDNGFTEEEFLSTEDITVTNVSISKNHIFIEAWLEKRENGTSLCGVQVYDLDGNYITRLCEDEDYDGIDRAPGEVGPPSGVVETSNGFIVCDYNFNSYVFYSPNGEPLGSLSTVDLFGLDHQSWRFNNQVRSPSLAPDGSLIFGVIAPRADEEGDEIIVYRITGF